MDIKRMKYSQELLKNKIRLAKELRMVNSEIDKQQETCNHISICLGWDGSFQYRDTSIHTCLLCQEYDPDSRYKIIDATNYKKSQYSHGEIESYREDRLVEIQEIAMNMTKENPSITEEELVDRLTKLIKKEEEKTKYIEKKLDYKFI